MSTHCALGVLGVRLWSLGSAPACASLALVCAIHAALGGSVLEFKMLRALHILKVRRKGKLLSGPKGRGNILPPLSNVGDVESSLRW